MAILEFARISKSQVFPSLIAVQAGLMFILQHQVAHRDYRMAIYLAAECMAGLAFDTEAGDHE